MGHKKRKVKYFSFLIVPDNKDAPRSFKLRTSILSLLIGAGIAIVVLIVAGAASYWKVAEVALDYNRLEEENFKLHKSLNQMEQLKADLNKVQQFEKQIRSSLSGYVSVEKVSDADTLVLSKLNFEQMSLDQRKTIFNSIPSVRPVEGFMTRGLDVNSLLTDPHLGIDIAAPMGSPIRATADGVVTFAGWTDDAGYVLIVEHGFGFSSLYKHNERNMVGVMEKVSKGQVIALLGDTGKISSGAHLHFEVWKNGNPVDPVFYIGEIVKDKS
ncbi:MAG: peptidoglycan DD-metalloendopeptidase family protein [Calditrichaceae bacterium]